MTSTTSQSTSQRTRRARSARHLWLAVVATLVAGCDGAPTHPEPAHVPAPPTSEVATTFDLFRSGASAELSEEALAQRWIAHAARLLERAVQKAGPDPEPPISSWLQAAAQMLSQARASFEGGNYQAAVSQAQSSAEKSKKVLEALAEEPAPQDLEEAAARAIASASALLERATELAGPEPDPHVAAALEDARRHLESAQEAFEAGEFAAALRQARESAALSRRVIDHLSPTTARR